MCSIHTMLWRPNIVHNLTNKDLYTALETAKKYYVSTKAAKHFIDNNLDAIVYHLLSQSPRNLSITRDNLGQSEYAMVEKSIRFALVLVVEDLRTIANKLTTQCQTLQALELILDYKSLYYEESPLAVRMDKILVFQRLQGFYHLGVYLNARFNTSSFPEWDVIHRAFKSALDGIEASHDDMDAQLNFRKCEQDMIC